MSVHSWISFFALASVIHAQYTVSCSTMFLNVAADKILRGRWHSMWLSALMVKVPGVSGPATGVCGPVAVTYGTAGSGSRLQSFVSAYPNKAVLGNVLCLPASPADTFTYTLGVQQQTNYQLPGPGRFGVASCTRFMSRTLSMSSHAQPGCACRRPATDWLCSLPGIWLFRHSGVQPGHCNGKQPCGTVACPSGDL